MNKPDKKPLIGFFPFFRALGDTYPLIQIAKQYMKHGGKAIFFSHCEEYEKLAEEIGCKVIRMNPYYHFHQADMGKILEELHFGKNLSEAVEEEIKAFRKTNIKLLVTSATRSSSISARAVNILLVFTLSGSISPPYLADNYETFPDQRETFLTRLIPHILKDRIFNWYRTNARCPKMYNKLAEKYHIPKFKRFIDIDIGDYTLFPDSIEFLGI